MCNFSPNYGLTTTFMAIFLTFSVIKFAFANKIQFNKYHRLRLIDFKPSCPPYFTSFSIFFKTSNISIQQREKCWSFFLLEVTSVRDSTLSTLHSEGLKPLTQFISNIHHEVNHPFYLFHPLFTPSLPPSIHRCVRSR